MERNVIHQDRWDVQDYTQAKSDVPTIPTVEERLSELSWTAGRLLADAFTSIHKASPELADRDDVDRPFRVNHQVMGELMDTRNWADIREYTVGDQYLASLAVTKMADQLAEILDTASEAQRKQEEAAEAAEAHEHACAEAGATPGDADAEAQAPGLRDMREAAERKASEADDALSDIAPSLARAARAVARDVAQDVAEEATAFDSWGMGPGEASKMSPAEREALAARLSTPRMQKIADMFGRLRSEMWADYSNRWDLGPDEIADITMSDDLNRLTGGELLTLAVPELEADFLDRWSRKQLLTFEMHSRQREARGRIIYVEDASSSMHGDAEIWARAIGLVLLDIATRQGRGFTAIVFSGSGSEQVFEFPGEPSIHDRLGYAEFIMGGGTWFEGPLGTALASLESEKEQSGRTTGDIVFATDGDAPVSDDFIDGWAQARQRLGFRCWGIAVSMGVTPSLQSVCDQVAEVSQFANGADVKAIFTNVTSR